MTYLVERVGYENKYPGCKTIATKTPQGEYYGVVISKTLGIIDSFTVSENSIHILKALENT